MEVRDAIRKRRSCRHFSNKKVKQKDLATVLDAAVYAPMAGNAFPLRFIIVTDIKKKADLAVSCVEQYFMQEASHLIVISTDYTEIKSLYHEFAEEYAGKQAAAAAENMLLQATELGLASCWIGSFDEDRIKAALHIPDEQKVEVVIALGYAKRKSETPPKTELNKFVFFEVYGKPEGFGDKHTWFWATREDRFEKI